MFLKIAKYKAEKLLEKYIIARSSSTSTIRDHKRKLVEIFFTFELVIVTYISWMISINLLVPFPEIATFLFPGKAIHCRKWNFIRLLKEQ